MKSLKLTIITLIVIVGLHFLTAKNLNWDVIMSNKEFTYQGQVYSDPINTNAQDFSLRLTFSNELYDDSQSYEPNPYSKIRIKINQSVAGELFNKTYTIEGWGYEVFYESLITVGAYNWDLDLSAELIETNMDLTNEVPWVSIIEKKDL